MLSLLPGSGGRPQPRYDLLSGSCRQRRGLLRDDLRGTAGRGRPRRVGSAERRRPGRTEGRQREHKSARIPPGSWEGRGLRVVGAEGVRCGSQGLQHHRLRAGGASECSQEPAGMGTNYSRGSGRKKAKRKGMKSHWAACTVTVGRAAGSSARMQCSRAGICACGAAHRLLGWAIGAHPRTANAGEAMRAKEEDIHSAQCELQGRAPRGHLKLPWKEGRAGAGGAAGTAVCEPCPGLTLGWKSCSAWGGLLCGSGGCTPGLSPTHTAAIVASSLLGNERGLNIVVLFNRECFRFEMTLVVAGWIICCE